MRGEEWQAAVEAEAAHTGDEAWLKDFRHNGKRDAVCVTGAALLAVLGLPLFSGLVAGWGIVALTAWLTLLGFGLGRLHVPRSGAVLLGLYFAFWLTWQNVLTGQAALGLGGVICLILPGFIGWQFARGQPERREETL